MTPIDRFERRLPDQLDELAAARTPAYLDDLLTRTAATRQRPRWAFPERWIPMTIALRRPALAPPWRALAVGMALLLALLTTLALLAIMASPRPSPAVINLPGNGPIVAAQDGRLVLLDPETGSARDLVTDPGLQVDPQYSPDGERLAWWTDTGDGGATLHLAPADPSDPGAGLTHELSFPGAQRFAWSPDSTRLAVWTAAGSFDAISIVTDQRDATQAEPSVDQLVLGTKAGSPAWRPDSGAILVRGEGTGDHGLYVVSLTGDGTPRLIKGVADGAIAGGQYDNLDAQWSPDGRHIAYHSLHPVGAAAPDENGWRVHVMDADGSNDHELEFDPMSDDEFRPVWSADSTRLLYPRLDAGVITLVLAPADGSARGMVTDPITSAPTGDWSFDWAPDETRIVGADHDHGAVVLIDAATGTATPTAWRITAGEDWQPRPAQRSRPAVVSPLDLAVAPVVLERDGDLWTYDPTTGDSAKAMPDAIWPFWSHDGRQLFYVDTSTGGQVPTVWDAASRTSHPLTDSPMADIQDMSWSPTGSSIAISGTVDGKPTVSILAADRTGQPWQLGSMVETTSDWAVLLQDVPGGATVLARVTPTPGDAASLYRLTGGSMGNGGTLVISPEDLDTSVGARAETYGPTWDFLDPTVTETISGSGLLIAYTQLHALGTDAPDGDGFRVHIFGDGKDNAISYDPTADDEAWPAWDPKGARVAFQSYERANNASRVVIAMGVDPGCTVACETFVASEPIPVEGPNDLTYTWSPDGRELFVLDTHTSVVRLMDASTGRIGNVGWSARWIAWR